MKKFSGIVLMMVLVMGIPSIVSAGPPASAPDWIKAQGLSPAATIHDWNVASKNVCLSTTGARLIQKMEATQPGFTRKAISTKGTNAFFEFMLPLATNVRSCVNTIVPLYARETWQPVQKIIDACIANLNK
jgi:hypothetical protein